MQVTAFHSAPINAKLSWAAWTGIGGDEVDHKNLFPPHITNKKRYNTIFEVVCSVEIRGDENMSTAEESGRPANVSMTLAQYTWPYDVDC